MFQPNRPSNTTKKEAEVPQYLEAPFQIIFLSLNLKSRKQKKNIEKGNKPKKAPRKTIIIKPFNKRLKRYMDKTDKLKAVFAEHLSKHIPTQSTIKYYRKRG